MIFLFVFMVIITVFIIMPMFFVLMLFMNCSGRAVRMGIT
jgi:hypothetical protein